MGRRWVVCITSLSFPQQQNESKGGKVFCVRSSQTASASDCMLRWMLCSECPERGSH